MSYLWTPPPVAVDVVVECLGFSCHKRPNCLHLVVIPWLMDWMMEEKVDPGKQPVLPPGQLDLVGHKNSP